MSKFFSYEERLHLQSNLKEGLSFKEISRRLEKDPSTISREVRNYSSEIATGYPGQTHNTCKNRRTCNRRRICDGNCSRSVIYCKNRSLCNQSCTDYVEEVCWARLRAPYICNGCSEIGKCSLVKNFYDTEKTHIRANETISESRNGLCVAEQEVIRLNQILSPLVQQGQSLHQIYINHKDELMCSEKTMLTQSDIDLMMNHINSYKRKKLNNRSPYETFSFYHGEEVLEKLECKPVRSGNIILKPSLLKK